MDRIPDDNRDLIYVVVVNMVANHGQKNWLIWSGLPIQMLGLFGIWHGVVVMAGVTIGVASHAVQDVSLGLVKHLKVKTYIE